MKSKNLILTFGIIFIISVLSSCAPLGHTHEEYGFLFGIIHGIVFPFALIGKLFGVHVGLYAENNTGFFYWLGFILGLGMLGGGGAASRS